MHSLIINSPYSEPTHHWEFVEPAEPLAKKEGRRKAGYMIADPRARRRPHQDRGIFVELELAEQIRQRVAKWRNENYPGVTGITKSLLEHWHDREQREYPFFFCQIEAIETLIYLIEAPDSMKTGITIPKDDGAFQRLCCKLATGTGKTVVMAMLIAWQVINRATYPRDGRFSLNVFVVAPNLTVRERLSVLMPKSEANYYDEFGIVPESLREKLRRGKVRVRNWHALNWESEEQVAKKKSVDKRGVKSDRAYTREVLGDMSNERNLIVINDEAHHAWRATEETKITRDNKENWNLEEATKWIGGLDRIHATQGILNCFDFSATPFMPSGHRNSEEALFKWIVSDFGLNDAIESGLVKTPRIVVRDDAVPNARTYKSRLYHIYSDDEVKDDFNRKAEPHEPLPELVTTAYALLGADWLEAKKRWSDRAPPPVMITVANRTETAARIKHAFDDQVIVIPELCEAEGILHIDSKVLKEAETIELESETADVPEDEGESGLTAKQRAILLRDKVNTVGQHGKHGEKVQNVISVGMLSEGWDARTVTHIMGLRAFTSQLLCEQVVGRGLRRASYEINEKTGLFDAEYVNVFGVPFSFLPHEDSGGDPLPPVEKITVRPVKEKEEFAIQWPNVLRIERTYQPKLSVDWTKVTPLEIDSSTTPSLVEIAPTVDNNPDLSKITDIDLEKLMQQKRKQTVIFETAQKSWRSISSDWQGSPEILMAELVRLTEQFINSDLIQISPALFNNDEKKRQLVITLNMSKVMRHFQQAIEFHNTEKTALVLDSDYPIRATGDMRPWRTGKPCAPTRRSHINYCVFDSAWEASESFELDRNAAVAAWVKNDHLGFEVLYVHDGVVRKYYPDFLIRMKTGEYLVLETKGQQTEQDNSKHKYMREWVAAVSADGGYGKWHFEVSRKPSDIKDILAKYVA